MVTGSRHQQVAVRHLMRYPRAAGNLGHAWNEDWLTRCTAIMVTNEVVRNCLTERYDDLLKG